MIVIIEEVKNIKGGKSELRKFGITVGIFVGLIGAFLGWRVNGYHYYFFMLSTALLFFGLAVPTPLKPVHKIWMTLAILMGWFVTRVILIVLFYLVVTPIGLLAKLFRKDFLTLKFNGNAENYWIPKGKVEFKRSDYERQF